ncbi:hypothetical protein TNCT_282751 [Trichonephila clavata]|uniref:Uncharacterized protein n=1 Tax=Trichonephila clavata TaxID=2740835 RepID=A0A8X6FB31_TRICU|nr:hypothetical protein TNCT_282751 [Trichonephila clavata]
MAGPTSSIRDKNSLEIKTMLVEISSLLSCLETRDRSTSRGPEGRFPYHSSIRESGAHKHYWYHRCFKERLPSAGKHVLSRRKTRVTVSRPTE